MTTSGFGRIDRRRLVASSAIGGAAILTAGSLARAGTRSRQSAALVVQAESSDVPMFRGNAARTGEMPGPGPDHSNGVEAIWIFGTGGEIVSSPAVVDGVVYVGSIDTHLYAISVEDGAERWRFQTGDWIASSPAVVDGAVYVGSGDGYLYAVDAEEGTQRWRFQTGGNITSSPAVVDGVVYVGSYDDNLYAVNATDGAERWRFAGDGPIGAAPAVVDGTVYILGARQVDLQNQGNNLYAVDAGSGLERWRFDVDSPPILDGGFFVSPAVVEGVIYLGSGTGEIVLAINAEDGTERWRFATGGRTLSSPAVVDGVVYIGSEDDNLYALNAEDGTEAWRFAVNGSIYSSPAVVDGIAYFCFTSGSSRDGDKSRLEVISANAQDGTERWRFTDLATYAAFGTSPVILDTIIYVASSDGLLYALGAWEPRLGVGGAARVTATVSLRGGPAPTAVERAELAPDTEVTITGEAETAGDVVWWPVTVDETGDLGWVEASALEPLSSGPEPTPTA